MANQYTSVQQSRIDMLEKRMDKYDEILSELTKLVAELTTANASMKATNAANSKWVLSVLSIGCAIVGATAGALISYLVR